jgi:hypothetical protein
MVKLEVENLKALREALCVAQSAIGQAYGQRQSEYKKSKVKQIQKVIDQIDILRPLGSNGKHGGLHTEFCGCEDNPYLDLLNSWRQISEYPWYELSGRGAIRFSSALDNETITQNGGEILAQDLGLSEASYHIMVDKGEYIESFMAPVSYLLSITFPELTK